MVNVAPMIVCYLNESQDTYMLRPHQVLQLVTLNKIKTDNHRLSYVARAERRVNTYCEWICWYNFHSWLPEACHQNVTRNRPEICRSIDEMEP